MIYSVNSLLFLALVFQLEKDRVVEGSLDISPRIIGGQHVNPGEIPYGVSIQSHDGKYFCGGSIIEVGSVMAVLSAAHCFTNYSSENPADWIVRAGTVEFVNITDGLQLREIVSIVSHENYNRETEENDIALLFLNETFQISDVVSPIGLPKEGQDFTGASAIVSGWGDQYGNKSYSDQLLSTELSVWSHSDCQKKWETHPLNQNETIYDAMICIGDVKGFMSSCHGDSGGPAAVLGNELVGICSHGDESCNPIFPAIFTEVSRYINWINQTMMDF